jgi:hypothetical protein
VPTRLSPGSRSRKISSSFGLLTFSRFRQRIWLKSSSTASWGEGGSVSSFKEIYQFLSPGEQKKLKSKKTEIFNQEFCKF